VNAAPVSFQPLETPGMDGDAWVVCTQKSRGKRRTVAHTYTAEHAQLFAAAPDLLAACKDMMEGRGDWGARIAEAIAKAEGR